jgi:hypothetical protein
MKEPELIKHLAEIRRMEKHFANFSFRHIPRCENAEADELAKAAAQSSPMPADVFLSIANGQSHTRRGRAASHGACYRK